MSGCVDFVPYNFKPETASSSKYIKAESSFVIVDARFSVPEDGCQIWEYKGTGATGASDWIVRVNGGDKETKGEVEEPFIFQDRGAWFDGKYDLMKLELIKYSMKGLNMQFMYKPHSDGVLYSSNRQHRNTEYVKVREEEKEDGRIVVIEESKHDNIDWDQALPGTDYSIDTHTRDRTIKRTSKPVSWYLAIVKGKFYVGTNTVAHGFRRGDGEDIKYFIWQTVSIFVEESDSGYF